MSEPSLERLIRFTPDAGELDRDALLFAAGRSSARPNRGWMALAALLGGTQVLSLALLWPPMGPRPGGLTGPMAAAPSAPVTLEPPTSGAPAGPGRWVARRSLLEAESPDRPAGDVTLIESGPPLRAFAPPPPSLLN
jgi:hypothetical protein